jgi:hypothetical protein
MRKVFFTLGAIVLVAVGAAFYFIAYRMDSVIESRIERAATVALGSAVEVGGVHTDLRKGTLTVDEISVANPPGFKNAYAVQLNGLEAAVDYKGLEIRHVVVEDPEFIIEEVGGETNFEQMLKALDAGKGPVTGGTDESASGAGRKAEPVIVVRQLRINESRAVFDSASLDKIGDVKVDAIEMNDLRGTPSELAEQIGREVLDELSSEAARELLKGQTKRQLKKMGGSVSGALRGILGGEEGAEEEASEPATVEDDDEIYD